MRIAMIGHKRYGSREGGVEVVVTELARRMAALGHEVTCYDRSGSDVMTGDAASTQERVILPSTTMPVLPRAISTWINGGLCCKLL